jgi:hypothetical protein
MLRWEEIRKRIQEHKPYRCKFPKCKSKVIRPESYCHYHDNQIFDYKKKRFGG